MQIVIKLKNGGISIISVDEKAATKDFIKHYDREPESQEELAKFEFEKSERIIGAGAVPKNRHESWRIAGDAEIPQDRYFRKAWEDNGTLSVNMPKARDIHMDRIRAKRNEKLKELDIETLKGRDVQTEKQALRDIPQTFDLTKATTPEELKALWPDELK